MYGADHQHYEYASERHDHRGQYAEDRHDHYDYAEWHHRHYDLEREDDRLQDEIRELSGEIAVLRRELEAAYERIGQLEQRDAK